MLGNEGLSIFGDDHSGENLLAYRGVKGTTYYVDNGAANDNNSGTSWALAKKTIQAALDLCTGYNTVLVATGGYVLTLTTPLNATAPFCQLIGVNSTDDMGYGPWLMSTTAGQDNLTIRARGWRISGFEFDLRATGGAIILDKENSGCSADYTVIDHCLFAGAKDSSLAIDFKNHVRMATIRDCEFFDIFNSGGTGKAIGCSYSGYANPYHLKFYRNIFRANDRHMETACNHSLIEDNLFLDGDDVTATKYLALSGSVGHNVVRRNVFDGTYDIANGYNAAQTTDIWCENYNASGALITAHPG